jgi:hypothetical protein
MLGLNGNVNKFGKNVQSIDQFDQKGIGQNGFGLGTGLGLGTLGLGGIGLGIGSLFPWARRSFLGGGCGISSGGCGSLISRRLLRRVIGVHSLVK